MIKDVIKMMLEVPEELNLIFLEKLIKDYKEDFSVKSTLAIQCLITYLKLSGTSFKKINEEYDEYVNIREFYDKLKH